MSFLDNMSRVFSASTGTPAPAAGTPPAGTPPVAPVITDVPLSPLDSFKDLWNNPTTPSGSPPAPPTPGSYFANANPAKVLESARKINFAQGVNPEMLSVIAGGGEAAAKALVQLINDVGQRSYAQATLATTQITDSAFKTYNDGSESRIPSLIKQHSVAETIKNSNPALQHPAAAPILEALQAQLTVKYPTATVDEIRAHAADYLKAFSAAASPAAPVAANPADKDWSSYFG